LGFWLTSSPPFFQIFLLFLPPKPTSCSSIFWFREIQLLFFPDSTVVFSFLLNPLLAPPFFGSEIQLLFFPDSRPLLLPPKPLLAPPFFGFEIQLLFFPDSTIVFCFLLNPFLLLHFLVLRFNFCFSQIHVVFSFLLNPLLAPPFFGSEI